jgi:hypothetical protein
MGFIPPTNHAVSQKKGAKINVNGMVKYGPYGSVESNVWPSLRQKRYLSPRWNKHQTPQKKIIGHFSPVEHHPPIKNNNEVREVRRGA